MGGGRGEREWGREEREKPVEARIKEKRRREVTRKENRGGEGKKGRRWRREKGRRKELRSIEKLMNPTSIFM